MFRYEAGDALPRIDIPTLVVYGDRDPVTTAQANRHIDATLPNSRAFPLSPAKHLGPLEHHEAFDEAVEQFVEQVASAEPTAHRASAPQVLGPKVQS